MIDRRDFFRYFSATLMPSASPMAVRSHPAVHTTPGQQLTGVDPMNEVRRDVFDPIKIAAIGVGGGGNNAVNCMVTSQASGVEFIAVNTDWQNLTPCPARKIIQLGTSGQSTGGQPELARVAAFQSEHALRMAMDGADMLFITAGLGGGTGTGAAPVIARIAKEMGILTVGLVTLPFEFEGPRRVDAANSGLTQLQSHVDAVIVISNQKLLDSLGDDVSMADSFKYVNELFQGVVSGFSGLVNLPSLVNADLEDVRTILSEPGKAALGVGLANGQDRGSMAAQLAITCTMMEGVDLTTAKGVVVMIAAAKDDLTLSQIRSAVNVVRANTSPDAYVIYGTMHDQRLNDGVRVTVVATGLKSLAI